MNSIIKTHQKNFFLFSQSYTDFFILLFIFTISFIIELSVSSPIATYIPSVRPQSTTPFFSDIHVQGNKLVNVQNQTVQLQGVNRSGTEYACVQGWGLSDGPLDEASVQAISSWHINAVRIPLNEDCWLGINGVSVNTSGALYQNAISAYVQLLNKYHLYPILDLHWSAARDEKATDQKIMADKDHSIDFWESVANTFGSNQTVIFDLYNEPHDISWSCWKNGKDCPTTFHIASMQDLIDGVRKTGANNILMLGGIGWSGDLSQWWKYQPNDPKHNLAASWHMYHHLSSCQDENCWENTAGRLAKKVPVITGEFNERNSQKESAEFIKTFAQWMDMHGISYLAWTWNTWHDWQSLITNYNGTPTEYDGKYYKEYLLRHY